MSDLVLTGLNMAMYGMGFVFVFLLLLVGLTNLMSTLVRRFSPVVTVAQKHSPGMQRVGNTPKSDSRTEPFSQNQDNSRLVAIMSAAIKQHRSGLD